MIPIELLLTIIIGILAFRFIYYLLDAFHDNWMLKEKEYTKEAEACRINNGKTPHYFKLLNEAKKHSKKWHMIDAWIKGIVEGMIAVLAIEPILYLQSGHFLWSWWFVILPISGGVFRWNYFDGVWNLIRKLSWFNRGSVAKSELPGVKDWLFWVLKFGSLLFTIGITIWYIFNQ